MILGVEVDDDSRGPGISGVLTLLWKIWNSYPLVMTNILKDPPFLMGKSTISMVIFNSYFDITRGYWHLATSKCILTDVWLMTQQENPLPWLPWVVKPPAHLQHPVFDCQPHYPTILTNPFSLIPKWIDPILSHMWFSCLAVERLVPEVNHGWIQPTEHVANMINIHCIEL